MTHIPGERDILIPLVFRGLEERSPLQPLLDNMGIARTTWHRWMGESPQHAAHFARAREAVADALVEECLAISRDRDTYPDPKERRVIIDTNLRVAALYHPQRWSQTALDRLVAPEVDPDRPSPMEIAQALMRAVEVAKRLPAPRDDLAEDAEFHDA